MALPPKNNQKKVEPKPEPPKALPPYNPVKQNWVMISVGIALIAVVIIIYLQMPRGHAVSPTPIPTILTETPMPTSIPTSQPTPIITEEAIPTITHQEQVKCGNVAKNVTLTGDLESQGTCLSIVNKDVTIDCNGFKIIGEQNKSSLGIFSNFSGTVIRNCEISKFEVGVSFKKADFGIIEDSTFLDNLGSVFLENSDFLLIQGNKFLKTTEGAVRAWGIENSTFQNNFIDNNLNYGFYFSGSDNNQIQKNSVFRSNIGLQLAESNNNLIADNNFTYNGGGVKLTQQSTNNLIQHNLIQESNGIGIHTIFADGNTIIGNTVTKNEYGIDTYDSKEVLQNNFVCYNSIEDMECLLAQSSLGNTCLTRATTCEFQCTTVCPAH